MHLSLDFIDIFDYLEPFGRGGRFMRKLGRIMTRRKSRLHVLSAVVLFAGCLFLDVIPAVAQPQGIDFSITKAMLPDGIRPDQGEAVTFLVTGTMPYSSQPFTTTLPGYTFPGEVMMTDTLPTGLGFGGLTPPPGWDCGVVTQTIPSIGVGQIVAYEVRCSSQPGMTISGTVHFPLRVTAVVETPDNLLLTQSARIGTGSGIITGTMPPDPDPSNNRADLVVEVNPTVNIPVGIGKKAVPMAVPTLGQWGMLTFVFLLGAVVVYTIRKKTYGKR
jgi:hypothetical protein